MVQTPKKIQYKCPRCGKTVANENEFKRNNVVTYILSCGHVTKEKLIEVKETEFKSLNGKTPFKFQSIGYEFLVKANFRALVGDEMGLGKTIQALMAIIRHQKEVTPALVICPSNITIQWMYETLNWGQIPAFVIKSGKTKLFPGFKLYIISYDLLRRLPDNYFDSIGLKLLVLDECQRIKGHSSQRTQEVRKLAKKVKHVIALSGTPIKNRVAEYFPILNILRPDIFNSFEMFRYRWIDTYYDYTAQKIVEAGLKNPKLFFDTTKDFIIRRTRSEVLPDLPKTQRNFRYVEFENGFQQAYEKTMQEFVRYLDTEPAPFSFENYANTLAYMAKMRHLCGLAKVEPTFDYINDFLLETDRKIIVFLQHLNVAKLLKGKLKEANISYLQLTAGMNADQNSATIADFQNGKCRVMLASTLATSEGTDGLQSVCSDLIMMERQWNPANEEQAESRLERIGQAKSIAANYMIAIGTVDEYLTKLVEQKRAMIAETMTGKTISWNETSVIKELTEIIYRNAKGVQ